VYVLIVCLIVKPPNAKYLSRLIILHRSILQKRDLGKQEYFFQISLISVWVVGKFFAYISRRK